MNGSEMRKPIETPQEWFRLADENLLVAEQALLADMPVFHTICFLAQNAAEKYLKRYLIAAGWTLEKTHDIVVLLGLSVKYDAAFEGLLDGGVILNEYIVAGRYPGDLAFEEIGKTEAEESVKIVRQIQSLVI